jgi:hypothetical protein
MSPANRHSGEYRLWFRLVIGYPRSGHAGIAAFIGSMVLCLGIHVLRPVGVVLERRERADQGCTGVEDVEHGASVLTK